ncbi:ECF transporter S component [Candidatus Bathyarchaeota archaeon]|nr:ECF transporter S component [Candidatus Bathyarchaeota archaeon]
MIKPAAKILLSITAICLASRFFLFVPNTLGLLNIGEIVFFTAALLLNPLSGTIVGAAGFLLADLLLGYPHYIYASVTAKALTGFVVSLINRHSPKKPLLYLMQSLLLTVLFASSGVLIYSGTAYFGYVEKLSLGEAVMEHGGVQAYSAYLPAWLWIMLSLTLILCLYAGSGRRWSGLAILAGAIITSLIYLLYETLILPVFFGINVDARANALLNLGQAVISGSMAIIFIKTAGFLKQLWLRL